MTWAHRNDKSSQSLTCSLCVSVSIRAAGSRRFVPTLAGMAVFVFEGDASGAGAMPVPPAYDVVYAAPVQVPPPAYVPQNAGAYSFAQPAQATFHQAPPRTRCSAHSYYALLQLLYTSSTMFKVLYEYYIYIYIYIYI